MKKYFDELEGAMINLSRHPMTIFLGQNVKYDGNLLSKTLINVPEIKKIELPVFEDFQMGLSTGLAMEGFIPISIYPRMDFLILAANQLTNHLSNIKSISNGGYNPKVLIRVAVGATQPLYSGLQHSQDHSAVMRLLCKNGVNVVELKRKQQIASEYKIALERQDGLSTILIEYGDLYNT
jgi:pyruvate/2-oxoglutarate/acetoin dehydrogenase E1 component